MRARRAAATHDPIIGREAQLAIVEGALRSSRLVTLTGLGGAGKTRLAAAYAEGRNANRSRVMFIDLAPVRGSDAVIEAIASALGIAETTTEALETAVPEDLGSAPTTLVLDNVEHLPGAGGLIGRLLDAAPTLRVLATSRVRLQVDGELEVRVGSLAIPETERDVETAPASRLFLRRAGDRGGLRSLRETDAPAVVAICRRLGGLPLAIELAAAWTTILSPRAILRRLEDRRLDLGDEGSGRHASLEQITEAALELCGTPERTAFDRLGVFNGPFDDSAAAAVCDDRAILASLRGLEGVALLVASTDASGEPRFRLLEPIRSIAFDRLTASGDRPATELRHVAWYADRSDAAADMLRTRAFERPDAARELADPNMVAAFDQSVAAGDGEAAGRLAAALGTYGVRAGLLRASAARLRTALAMGPASPGTQADVLNAHVSIRGLLGDVDGIDDEAREAAAAARLSGDPTKMVRTLITLGNWARGEALERYREAAELADSTGFQWGAAVAWGNLGELLSDLGQPEHALIALDRAAAIHGERGDRAGLALSLSARGAVELDLGRDQAALDHCRAADAIAKEAGTDAVFGLWMRTTRAQAEALAGDPAVGARLLAEAVPELHRLDSRFEIGGWLEAAAVVLATSHPALAARCAGVLDGSPGATGVTPSARPVLRRLAGTLERRLGRYRLETERAAGRKTTARVMLDRAAVALRQAARGSARTAIAPFGSLTDREQQVLRLLAHGRTDPEIAAELGISAKTASVHVANAKAKLGATTRVEAVLLAREQLGPE
jgi:non-specific serine/threonine protein kinase